MHSSRMRTVRNSSHLRGGGSPCPPRAGTPHNQGDPLGPGRPPWADPPQLPPWLWAWTGSPSTSPLAVGLDLIPLNFPLECQPGGPPGQIPLNFPLGCGPGNLHSMLGYPPTPMETCCKACWDTTCNACWASTPTPPPLWTDRHL